MESFEKEILIYKRIFVDSNFRSQRLSEYNQMCEQLNKSIIDILIKTPPKITMIDDVVSFGLDEKTEKMLNLMKKENELILKNHFPDVFALQKHSNLIIDEE